MCSDHLQELKANETRVQKALRRPNPHFQSVADFGQYLYALGVETRCPTVESIAARVEDAGQYAMEVDGHVVTPEFNPRMDGSMGREIQTTNRTWTWSVFKAARDRLPVDDEYKREVAQTWAQVDVFNRPLEEVADDDAVSEAGEATSAEMVDQMRQAVRDQLKEEGRWNGQ